MSKFSKRREKRVDNPEFREAYPAVEESRQTEATEPAREKKMPRFDNNEFSGPFEEESPAPAPRRRGRLVEPDEWGPAV